MFREYKQAEKCDMLYGFQKEALDRAKPNYFYALDT